MSTGFKVKLPPPPAPVFAAGATCREKHPSQHVRCDRAAGHDGGHLNKVSDVYWPAES